MSKNGCLLHSWEVFFLNLIHPYNGPFFRSLQLVYMQFLHGFSCKSSKYIHTNICNLHKQMLTISWLLAWVVVFLGAEMFLVCILWPPFCLANTKRPTLFISVPNIVFLWRNLNWNKWWACNFHLQISNNSHIGLNLKF